MSEDRVASILAEWCERHERGEAEAPSEVIRAHPEVAAEMEAERAVVLEGLPWVNGTELVIRSDAAMHHEQFDIISMSKTRESKESVPPVRAARRVEK